MKEKTRPKARIVVIDDPPVLRDGLMQLLCSQPDLECTGTADTTADARRLVAQSAPDLMILDLRLKSGDTRDIAEQIQLSVKTVETHRENIKSKLGLENAAELNEFARIWAHENLLPQLQPTPTTKPRGK